MIIMFRRVACGAALLVGLGAAVLPAQAPQDLYEAATIVTGQREDTREPGIARCFVDDLVKVSGDPRLERAPEVERLKAHADSFVSSYRYHDRLSGKPIHDEQGTRDRPHDLTVAFDSPKIDAALRSLGREPWTSHRPTLAVFVAVRQGASDYVTSRDGQHGYGQADALLAAAAGSGLRIAVPDEAALASGGLTFDRVRNADFDQLGAATAQLGAELPLVGTMMFSEADGGWIVDWRFAWGGKIFRWHLAGINFDAAFRNGLRGAAQIASGHGQPE
jgi:hypothetical protein